MSVTATMKNITQVKSLSHHLGESLRNALKSVGFEEIGALRNSRVNHRYKSDRKMQSKYKSRDRKIQSKYKESRDRKKHRNRQIPSTHTGIGVGEVELSFTNHEQDEYCQYYQYYEDSDDDYQNFPPSYYSYIRHSNSYYNHSDLYYNHSDDEELPPPRVSNSFPDSDDDELESAYYYSR
jgi:hypothetical protein